MKAKIALILFCISTLSCSSAEGLDHAVSLDLKDGSKKDAPLIAPYMIALRKAIEENWQCSSSRNNLDATIFFSVSPTGVLVNPHITQSSGSVEFDNCAAETIRRIGRFYAPPKINDDGVLLIHADFHGKQLSQIASKCPRTANQNVHQNSDQTPPYSPLSGNGQIGAEHGKFAYLPPRSQESDSAPPRSSARLDKRESSQLVVGDNAAQALTLTGSASTFKIISPENLGALTAVELSTYFNQLHDWLKQPLEELIR